MYDEQRDWPQTLHLAPTQLINAVILVDRAEYRFIAARTPCSINHVKVK